MASRIHHCVQFLPVHILLYTSTPVMLVSFGKKLSWIIPNMIHDFLEISFRLGHSLDAEKNEDRLRLSKRKHFSPSMTMPFKMALLLWLSRWRSFILCYSHFYFYFALPIWRNFTKIVLMPTLKDSEGCSVHTVHVVYVAIVCAALLPRRCSYSIMTNKQLVEFEHIFPYF